MTLGSRPEALVLGYLKNQSFLSEVDSLESVIIDWETNSAAVVTKENVEHIEQALKKENRYLRVWPRHHVRQRDETTRTLSSAPSDT